MPRSAGGVHKLLSTALPTRAFGLRLRYGLRIRRGSFLRPVSCGIVGFPWVAASAPSVRRSIPVVSDRSTTDPHRPLEGTSSCREAHVGERTSTTGSSEAPRPKRQGPSTPTVRSTRAYHRKGGGRRNGTKQYVLRGLFGTTGLCPVSTAWNFVGLWKDRDACFDRLVRDSRSCFPGRSVSLPVV